MQRLFMRIVLGVLIIFSFCSKNETDAPVIKITDGLKQIINPANPITGIVEEYELVEDLSIGVDEGDTNYVFGRPYIKGIDKEGNIYILDEANFRITKYDSSGKYLFSFGRKGQGPGEFLSVFSSFFDKSRNTYYLQDFGNQRINQYSDKGEFIGSAKYSGLFTRLLSINHLSQFVFMESKFDFKNQIDTKTFLIFTEEGTLLDTLFTIQQEIFSPIPGGVVFIKPFEYCMDNNDNFYIVFDDRYKINKYDSNGKLCFQFWREYQPVKLPEDEKEGFFGAVGDGEKMYRPDAPEFKFDIDKIFAMPNDEIWVLTSTLRNSADRLIDVFDTDGKYIRKIWANMNFEPIQLTLTSKNAYVVFNTEEGYPRVKRYYFKKL